MELMGYFFTLLFIIVPTVGAVLLIVSLIVYNWNDKMNREGPSSRH